jgi:hypothetical protein
VPHYGKNATDLSMSPTFANGLIFIGKIMIEMMEDLEYRWAKKDVAFRLSLM